jgi:Uma2 family endonuclease
MPTELLAEPSPDRFPSDEPEVEVLRGVELPKISPKRRHGRLQFAITEILESWAGGDGEVATEWRFWLSRDPGGDETSLVPDVAFVRVERMAPLTDEEAEEPPFAPDIAVEIRSLGDRERNIRTKVRLYLASGSRLVLDVDPLKRRILAYDRGGERTFKETMVFEHPEAEGLTFDVGKLFARADRKR